MLIPGVVAASLAAVPAGPLSVTITFPADLQFSGAAIPWDTPTVGVPGTVSVTGGTEPYSYQWTEAGSGIDSITNDTTANPTINTNVSGGGNPNEVTLTVTDADLTVAFDTADVNVEAS